jgi:hypothetical protein
MTDPQATVRVRGADLKALFASLPNPTQEMVTRAAR